MQYARIRQLSLHLDNRPGVLAEVSERLAAEGVDLLGMTIVDNFEQGVVRLIVDDPARADALLRAHGMRPVVTEVLRIVIKNRTGEFAALARAFASERVNIEYAYGGEYPAEANTPLFLRVDDFDAAERVLAALGAQRA